MSDPQTSCHRMSFEEYEARYASRRYEYLDGYAVPVAEIFSVLDTTAD